jgi:glycosyltransferase involved in cell wall biosynthesis
MAGKPFSEDMRVFIRQHRLEKQVIEVVNCSNEELRAFYSTAKAMLFPSLAEGFGWPVIEAQACGCPVVTSGFAPLTEIGGDQAIYCNPRDEQEVARQINHLLEESEELRDARIRGGLANVQRFLPEQMVSNYLDLYQTALRDR